MSEFPPIGPRRQLRNAARALRRGRSADPRKFVLFAQGRTGSTLFGELLASHPDVVFADEILRARVRSTRLWVAGQRCQRPDRVFGFHVKIYQLTDVQGVRNPGRWLRQLHDAGWQVFALRRRNLLRHVLSNMMITATGTVHDRSASGQHQRLTVDPDELVHWMHVREQVATAERTALHGLPHEAFVYEDDLADEAAWPATTERAFRCLGVDPVPVTTSLHRRSPGPLTELIANYDEVAAALTGTAYATFLTD